MALYLFSHPSIITNTSSSFVFTGSNQYKQYTQILRKAIGMNADSFKRVGVDVHGTVDIRNVKKKEDKIIRISSEEKRNLMNGILHDIEKDQRESSEPQTKKVTWKDMTNEHNNDTKISNSATSTTS